MDEEKQKADNFASFVQNHQIMGQIIREMKEIPDLPSEMVKKDDNNPLDKVEFPETGGVLTYMDGYEFPYQGFPYHEFVDKIDLMKKIGRAAISGFYHELKRKNIFALIALIPSIFILKSLVRSGIYTFYRLVERFRLKPLRYCNAMREVHRAFTIDNEEKESAKELKFMIRDLFCMTLEFDNAYRFRFQDIMEEFNQERFDKKPIRELLRVLRILSSREKQQEIIDTWKLARYVIVYYLVFDREILKIVKNMFFNLNIEKCLLNQSDKQFADKRKDYKFGFQ